MPILAELARRKRLEYFTPHIPKQAKILEVGCGNGWFGQELRQRGFANYTSLDLSPPADIVGDIREWRRLGICESEFDVIVAFELVEHVHCFEEFHHILKPSGLLMLTSPVPHLDWICWLMELAGLNQKRTSPHSQLLYFEEVPIFEPVTIERVAFVAQWGIFRNPQKAGQ